jgi:hypothetical protein
MTTNPNTPRDESPSDEAVVDDHGTRELPTHGTPVTEASAAVPPPPGSAATAPQRPEVAAPTATATALPPTPDPAAEAGTPGTAGTGAAATTAGTAGTAAAQPPYLRGPAPFAIILGLLGLLVAGVTLVSEVADLTVPWDDLGPWTVVAAGIVVLIVGAIGLRASRSQD